MKKIFTKPISLKEKIFHYCPGCGHGLIHRLIAEVIDELNIREKTIGIAPVGCAVLGYDYFNFDVTEAAHGRPPAVATGIKRALPENIVFTYQGDGDLAAIGMCEIIHAANRGESISTIFVNNATYGMTGGQMAPTTLIGQKTKTTPQGRDAKTSGYPIKMAELLSQLEGSVYIARCAVNNVINIKKTKQCLKKSFEIQINNEGFSMVEVLAMCPTNWNLSPIESLDWIEQNMIKYFPLGELKVKL